MHLGGEMVREKVNNLKHRVFKSLIVIGIAFASIIIMILIFKIGTLIYYHDFYNKAKCEFEIPELLDDFVPQGFEYRTEDNVFLISGYMNKDSTARIYIVEPDGSYKKVEIQNIESDALLSHAGGICSLGGYIYIAGCDGKCYVLTAESVMDSKSGDAMIIGSFETYNNADFCCSNGDSLYVGEYYYPIKYKTDTKHDFISPAGDENNAIITSFNMNNDMQLGVNESPVSAYSIRSTVQGMCFTDNNEIALSVSSIFKGSQLYCYDLDSISRGEIGSLFIDEVSIPVYYVDSSTIEQKIEVLPKSEGLAFCNGRVYILFESASNRFRYGKLIKGNYVFSYDLKSAEN